MGFSEELRRQADPIWDAIFHHPFLQALKAGTLPLEKFRYFLGQDWLYLDVFARTVALAISRAEDAMTLERLANRLLRPVEKPLHRKLCELLRMQPEEFSHTRPAPTNVAYMNHLLTTALMGGVGEIAAALLPCPWTYHEIGQRIGEVEHPVYSAWASFYASGFLTESVAAWRRVVDEAAERASHRVRAAMAEAFFLSSRYEYLFWEMAYRQEEWPV